MFKYFFTYKTDIPENIGFKLFSVEHVTWLAIIFVSCVLTCFVYKRSAKEVKRKMNRGIGNLLIALEISRDVILICLKKFSYEHLPLHLCGLAVIFIFWYSRKPNEVLGEILFSLNLPGAMSALLFCDWTMYPMCNFSNINSFTMHALMVIYIFMLLFSGEIEVKMENSIKSVIFLVFIFPPIYIINKLLNTNFFFVNHSSPGSPTEVMENQFGNPGYLLALFFLAVLVIVLLHIPSCVIELRKNKNDKDVELGNVNYI